MEDIVRVLYIYYSSESSVDRRMLGIITTFISKAGNSKNRIDSLKKKSDR